MLLFNRRPFCRASGEGKEEALAATGGARTIAGAREIAGRLLDNLGKVILGKGYEEQLAVMALMCRGHLLIEDVPGVGKTMLARSIATSVGGSFRRIQFTPDLLPADITGVSVFNQKTGDFEYRAGPIVAQVVLADEINRASPKTQAALLEAMEEHQVTVDGVPHPMPEPFIVMATQNPIEYEGTFPLPETELDRFLVRLHLGYPDKADEMEVLEAQRYRHPVDDLAPVVDNDDLLALQAAVRDVHVSEEVKEYIVSISEATRKHVNLYLGASPRGSLALYRLSQARAVLDDRDFVLPDDVKSLAYPALGHRVILSSSARIQGASTADAIAEVLAQVAVPGASPSV